MQDVLCVYYSRSGNTKKVMKSIAAELNAELVQLTDGVERGGLRGWFRCGLDAVKRDCPAARPIETERRLENYRLVIIGPPVCAGRCTSIKARIFTGRWICIRPSPTGRPPPCG